jgi:hypothetical protein
MSIDFVRNSAKVANIAKILHLREWQCYNVGNLRRFWAVWGR